MPGRRRAAYQLQRRSAAGPGVRCAGGVVADERRPGGGSADPAYAGGRRRGGQVRRGGAARTTIAWWSVTAGDAYQVPYYDHAARRSDVRLHGLPPDRGSARPRKPQPQRLRRLTNSPGDRDRDRSAHRRCAAGARSPSSARRRTGDGAFVAFVDVRRHRRRLCVTRYRWRVWDFPGGNRRRRLANVNFVSADRWSFYGQATGDAQVRDLLVEAMMIDLLRDVAGRRPGGPETPGPAADQATSGPYQRHAVPLPADGRAARRSGSARPSPDARADRSTSLVLTEDDPDEPRGHLRQVPAARCRGTVHLAQHAGPPARFAVDARHAVPRRAGRSNCGRPRSPPG